MFFVVVVLEKTDGTMSPAIYKFDNEVEAEKKFYQQFGGYLGNEDTQYIMCSMLDVGGYAMRKEWWRRPSEVSEDSSDVE